MLLLQKLVQRADHSDGSQHLGAELPVTCTRMPRIALHVRSGMHQKFISGEDILAQFVHGVN